jgi:ABC-type amino acid transport substrate-binding protein
LAAQDDDERGNKMIVTTRNLSRIFIFGMSVMMLATLLTLGLSKHASSADIQIPAKGQSPAIDSIRGAGEFRGGISTGAPGLLIDPATGAYVGPGIMIGKKIAEVLGVRFVGVDTDWPVMIAGLQANRYNVAIAPVMSNPQRLQVVDIVPYYVDGLCFSVRKDNPKMANITRVEQLDDPTINFTTATGSAGEAYIKKTFTKANIRSVQIATGATATEEVLSRRADVVSQNSSQAKVVLFRNPDLRLIPDVEECMRNPHAQVPVGMAVLKGDPVFTKFLTDVVNSMEKEIAAAVQKYSSPEFMIRK